MTGENVAGAGGVLGAARRKADYSANTGPLRRRHWGCHREPGGGEEVRVAQRGRIHQIHRVATGKGLRERIGILGVGQEEARSARRTTTRTGSLCANNACAAADPVWPVAPMIPYMRE